MKTEVAFLLEFGMHRLNDIAEK